METVKKLTPSKRFPDRIYVDFSSGETVRVTSSIVEEFNLAPQRVLSAEEYEMLRQESVAAQARSRALRIINARMLSRGELEARLVKLGETREDAEDTAEWCCDMGLIDDLEYGRQIVRGYFGRGYGKRKIQDELYKRKVPRELWDEALEEISDEDGPSNAAAYIESKLRGEIPDRDDKRRISNALARRGFNWDDINMAFSIYIEGIDDGD